MLEELRDAIEPRILAQKKGVIHKNLVTYAGELVVEPIGLEPTTSCMPCTRERT